jgi:hypothetical protein
MLVHGLVGCHHRVLRRHRHHVVHVLSRSVVDHLLLRVVCI